jgi:hypothetical protein
MKYAFGRRSVHLRGGIHAKLQSVRLEFSIIRRSRVQRSGRSKVFLVSLAYLSAFTSLNLGRIRDSPLG